MITTTNKWIENTIWQTAKNCQFYIQNNADIWQLSVNENLNQLDKLLTVLNTDEQTRASRYLRKQDHDRFIISRGTLRHILSKYLKTPPVDIQFKLTQNNKPVIDHPSTQLHFNLSDSEDRILIAIANSPVGIDVELIKPKFEYEEILNYNFSDAEGAYIKEADSLKRFFILWTCKEAILKATGIGLTDDLKLIPSLDGIYETDGNLLSTNTNWQLNSFMIDENYISTIATDISVEKYNFFKPDHSRDLCETFP